MRSILYVGMDVHKETISIAVFRDHNRNVELERTIKNERGQIKKFFTKLKEKNVNIICCYEVGPTGYVIYRQLEEMGIICLIAAPSLLPYKPGEKIKTDRRDARNLGKNLRDEEIVPIYVPTKSTEADKDYLRMCDEIRKNLKKAKQRLLMFLLRIGKKYQKKSYWTGPHRKWLKNLEFEEKIHKEVFDEYYTFILELEEKTNRLNERIEEIAAEERYKEKVGKLKCFKGIATLTALTLVTEIEDFRRFIRAGKFMAFLGMIPGEYSTGEKIRRGGITKTGNSRLRRLLIESSWHYKYYNPSSKRLTQRRSGQDIKTIAYADKAGRRLSKKYNRLIHRGKMPQKAVTAVARELAGFIWGMMVGKTELA